MIAMPWTAAALSGAIVTFACIKAIRKAGSAKRNAHWLVPFYRCLLYYVIPFTVAMLLLVAVNAYLNFSPGSLTYGELSTAQGWTDKVYRVFDRVKLAEWQILLILLVVFAVNYAVLSRRREVPGAMRLPFKIVDPYHKLTAVITVFFGVLCAFTFLGTESGSPTQQMELQLRAIQQGYVKLADKTSQALADQAPAALVQKAIATLPNDYLAALRPGAETVPNLPTKIDGQVNQLAIYYSQVRNRYGVRDRGLELLLSQQKARMARAAQLPHLLGAIPLPPEHSAAPDNRRRNTALRK